jgi:Tfp pilus assembly ATPase PilU
MQTFDQHLADLVTQGAVAFDVALAASTQPADFELKMNMFREGSGSSGSPFSEVTGGGRK